MADLSRETYDALVAYDRAMGEALDRRVRDMILGQTTASVISAHESGYLHILYGRGVPEDECDTPVIVEGRT